MQEANAVGTLEYTRAEAERVEAIILQTATGFGEMLVEWHERKGWRALGFHSVADWWEERTGKTVRQFYRVLEVGRDPKASKPKPDPEPPAENGQNGKALPFVTSMSQFSDQIGQERTEEVPADPPPKPPTVVDVDAPPRKPAEVLSATQLLLDFEPTLADRIDAAARDAGLQRKEWVEGAILAALDQKQERLPSVKPFAPKPGPARQATVGVSAINRGPHCPPGCTARTTHRFGRWICDKHG
jgi:hypothetical protein